MRRWRVTGQLARRNLFGAQFQRLLFKLLHRVFKHLPVIRHHQAVRRHVIQQRGRLRMQPRQIKLKLWKWHPGCQAHQIF